MPKTQQTKQKRKKTKRKLSCILGLQVGLGWGLLGNDEHLEVFDRLRVLGLAQEQRGGVSSLRVLGVDQHSESEELASRVLEVVALPQSYGAVQERGKTPRMVEHLSGATTLQLPRDRGVASEHAAVGRRRNGDRDAFVVVLAVEVGRFGAIPRHLVNDRPLLCCGNIGVRTFAKVGFDSNRRRRW